MTEDGEPTVGEAEYRLKGVPSAALGHALHHGKLMFTR